MKKLILATRNAHKVKELKELLKDLKHWEVLTLSDIAPDLEIIEDGNSYIENALKKAQTSAQKFNSVSLGEDSGLEVDALDGAPGIYSARFSGKDSDYEKNIQKLLTLLKDIPEGRRTACFRCVCAVAFPEKTKRPPVIFEGRCYGQISFEVRGTGGFGYDPVFIPEGFNKTFAELPAELKNKISHRALALKKIRVFLETLNENKNAEGGS